MLVHANINAAYRVMTSSRMGKNKNNNNKNQNKKERKTAHRFMYIQGNFRSETSLLSFKRREDWESERKLVERDFRKSGLAEDPNLSHAWADFRVKSGC